MGYLIEVGEDRPLLDATNAPLSSAGVTDPSGNPPPFAVGLAAEITVESGFLVCHGNSEGTITFDLKRGGTIASHEVTVGSIPFDWSLGDPL